MGTGIRYRFMARPNTQHPYRDKSRGTRLQKVLADAGVASRRHCEELILARRVFVNGTCVDSLPAWVNPAEDRISVDGVDVKVRGRRADGRPRDLLYILLNKPTNTVCTSNDPEGRRSVVDLVQYPGNPRLFSVGRLDADSMGLLILTNDGDFAHQLAHPSFEIHKVYEVIVRGYIDDETVKKAEAGLFLPERDKKRASKRTSPASLQIVHRERERSVLLMELSEGRNRQIRRMMARLGHPVKRLTRTQLGPLRLKKLPIGHWRPLTNSELSSLRKAISANQKRQRKRKPSSSPKSD